MVISHADVIRNLREKYDGYKVLFDRPIEPKSLNSVGLITRGGEERRAEFATFDYLRCMFDTNRVNGECARGTFLKLNDVFLVKEITEQSVRRTIDDLIRYGDVEHHFNLVRYARTH